MENIRQKLLAPEQWADIEMPELFSSKFKLEISNFGNARRTNILTNEISVPKESLTEGYHQVRVFRCVKLTDNQTLKFNNTRTKLAEMQKEIIDLKNEFELCSPNDNAFEKIANNIIKIEKEFKKSHTRFKNSYRKCENERRKYFGSLTHRLVAMHFLDKPSDNHNLVAHLDYDKLNNHFSNLQWMTREQNTKHQLSSPYVIEAKKKALLKDKITRAKLTTAQVATIKKRINEGIALRLIAKRFPVTETQLLRIKRGENWANVPAAL